MSWRITFSMVAYSNASLSVRFTTRAGNGELAGASRCPESPLPADNLERSIRHRATNDRLQDAMSLDARDQLCQRCTIDAATRICGGRLDAVKTDFLSWRVLFRWCDHGHAAHIFCSPLQLRFGMC